MQPCVAERATVPVPSLIVQGNLCSTVEFSSKVNDGGRGHWSRLLSWQFHTHCFHPEKGMCSDWGLVHTQWEPCLNSAAEGCNKELPVKLCMQYPSQLHRSGTLWPPVDPPLPVVQPHTCSNAIKTNTCNLMRQIIWLSLVRAKKDAFNTTRLFGCPKGNGEKDEAKAFRLTFFQLSGSVLQAKTLVVFLVLQSREHVYQLLLCKLWGNTCQSNSREEEYILADGLCTS